MQARAVRVAEVRVDEDRSSNFSMFEKRSRRMKMRTSALQALLNKNKMQYLARGGGGGGGKSCSERRQHKTYWAPLT